MSTKPAADFASAETRKFRSSQTRRKTGMVSTSSQLRLKFRRPVDAAPQFFTAADSPNAYLLSGRKRALDIVVASAVLVIVLPVLLLLAVIVRLSSHGPALFSQARNGQDCQSFNILKFRTMYHAPQEHGEGFLKQACRGDARVTPVGYWLRRLSLDELPQIINVLRGDMSLVGPRPHALSHDIYYATHIKGYYDRYRCRPGVTGLAQVSDARGETASHDDMQRRVDCDLRYIETASLMLDIRIIAKTAVKLLDNGGVY